MAKIPPRLQPTTHRPPAGGPTPRGSRWARPRPSARGRGCGRGRRRCRTHEVRRPPGPTKCCTTEQPRRRSKQTRARPAGHQQHGVTGRAHVDRGTVVVDPRSAPSIRAWHRPQVGEAAVERDVRDVASSRHQLVRLRTRSIPRNYRSPDRVRMGHEVVHDRRGSVPRWAPSPRTTSPSASTPSSATTLLGHLRFQLERFGPSCASTSSRPTTRSDCSAATSGGGCTRPPSTRTALRAGTTTTSRTPRATWSSSTAPSRVRPPTPARTSRRRCRCRRPSPGGLRAAGGTRSGPPGRQHLRDELRRAVRSGCRGAQPRGGARGLPAEHRRGRHLVVPPQRGGELVFQIGTAYFGCRDEDGQFDLGRLTDVVASAPVRAIEIKLSQGAKPGLAGCPGPQGHPGDRGHPRHQGGVDCASPSRHTAFSDVDSMLDLSRRSRTRPVCPSDKAAVGNGEFWDQLVEQMVDRGGAASTFVTVDGGEGGTGAAPMIFADAVSLLFRLGFAKVCREVRPRRSGPTTSRSSAPASWG